jgi:hypothetical protein
VGKRREALDVMILAEALLDLIDRMSDDDRQKLAAIGERAMKHRSNGRPSKEHAA